MDAQPTPPVAVVIEDDDLVRAMLVDLFESAGFAAHGFDSGGTGIQAVTDLNPAVTTIDINMPGIDGIETTRRVRAVSDTHIIVISALTDEADAVLALSAGADDFVAKPFRARELRARVDAALRRTATRPAPADPAPEEPAGQAPWVHHDLVLDPATRIAARDGVDIELTRTEFDIVAALLVAGRRVLTREDLVHVSRGGRDSGAVTDVDMRTIESHIAKIRRKLGEDPTSPRYIETVRGVGYRLTAP